MKIKPSTDFKRNPASTTQNPGAMTSGESDYVKKSMYDMNFKQKNTVSIKYRNKS